MTIDIEKLKAVTDIYCHASCPDGLSSAMLCAAAFSMLGSKPKIWFIQYGTEKMLKMEARPNQLFVDITPPLERWEEWKEHSPIVLDHHKTARKATEGLGGIYGTETQSGASLAYEHVFEPLFKDDFSESEYADWKNLAELAPIRDTWQDSHERWVEATGMAHALMQNNPYELVDAAREGKVDFQELFKQAKREGDRIDFKARKLAENAYFDQIQCLGVNYLLGVFNCTEKLISDAANTLLRHGCDIAVAYFMLCEDGGPKISISIRTNGEISAEILAAHNKGGGHDKAAGFRIDDGLNASVKSIVQVIKQSVWNTKTQSVKPDDGRERKTKDMVLQSLQEAKPGKKRS